LLAQGLPEWSERPDVLQAIAELYADHGSDGFDASRLAFQRAIQREDTSGRVAVRAIEQMANMEARQGGQLADAGRFDEAAGLIDSAIRRLNALADSVRCEGVSEINSERAAMLGSACKLKAATLASMGKPWTDVTPWLDKAAQAYRSGPSLYNTLNALPLAWLAGTLEQSTEKAAIIAQQCSEKARKSFSASKTFWDAIMIVDAEMTAWLLGDPLEEADGKLAFAGELGPVSILRRRYEQAVQSQPRSARQWNSVVKQWRLLAAFVQLSGRKEFSEQAETLLALADHFDPKSTVRAVHEADADAAKATARKPGKPRVRKQH
jgi:tetratricopeptide (TPR) repeat protein